MKQNSLFPLKFFLPFLILFFVGISCQTCSAVENKPLLFIGQDQVSAGTVVEGFEIRHTFLLQNRGNAPLIISKAETDCSCTKMHHDKIINPKSNSYFRVVFHTLGQVGEQVKTIRLTTNDPMVPERVITISAHVLPAVKVVPSRVFLNGPEGSPLSQTVTVTSPDDRPFDIEITKNELPPQILVSIKKDAKNHGYLIGFQTKGLGAGTSRGRIFLKTSIPHRPTVVIPLLVRGVKPLTLIPETIDFGRQKLSFYQQTITPDPSRTLNLKSVDGVPPKITSMDMDTNLFDTQIRYLPELGTTRVKITAMIRKFAARLFEGALVLELDKGRHLTVPIRVEAY